MTTPARARATRFAKELMILNKAGLHARPATYFVQTAQAFRSQILIITERGKHIAAGRIMELLLAALDYGTKFTLEASGPDAEEAVTRLAQVLVELRDAEEQQQPVPTIRNHR